MTAPAAETLVGRLLDGRYRIDGRIAAGGMATVYRGFDTRLDRVVAVKVMHPALAVDPDFVARFGREAKSAARLSHPNVVGVYDQGHDGESVFLVMEHVPGRTLRDLLEERRRLAPEQAAAILEPVLAALAAAHRAGLVHRDVKPENVLLGDDGQVKVADFGLARAVEPSTLTATTGLLIGTVAYLAPEQVATGAADARTDVYAAGILLYEMLTGTPPYAGETPLQVAYRHVHEDVPPPSRVVGGAPSALDALVVRATRRDPTARPGDAGQFLAALRRVRAGLPHADTEVLATRPSAGAPRQTLVVPRQADGPGNDWAPPPVAAGARRARPPRRRRRGTMLLILLLLLAVAAVSAGGWWLGSGRWTSAPELLGLSKGAAVSTAGETDVAVRFVTSAYSEDVPAGQILGQSPPPGDRVRRGTVVTATLSKGKERYDVPLLADRPLADAEAALVAASLTLGRVEQRYDERVAAGTVVSSSQRAGADLRRGTPVDVVVSRGPAPVAVLDMRGRPVAEAAPALEQSGLVVRVSERPDAFAPPGQVLEQAPAAGSVRRGSNVDLVVSSGPELVAVPDVMGRSAREARRAVEDAGLVAIVDDVFDGFGSVISQLPAAGTPLPRGSSVDVVIR